MPFRPPLPASALRLNHKTSTPRYHQFFQTQQQYRPSRMTIISISSIPRRTALIGSKSRHRFYSAVYRSSSSPLPSTTAGRQLQSFATDHSIHHLPKNNNIINSTIVNDPAHRRNILSAASRSMVTVTQTSASQKDNETPSPLIQNDATAPSPSKNSVRFGLMLLCGFSEFFAAIILDDALKCGQTEHQIATSSEFRCFLGKNK